MKICVVGAFDFSGKDTGGQPVKTRELFRALQDSLGKQNITYVETYQWKKHPLRMIRELVHIRRADRVIMLPADKGLVVFAKLILFLKCDNSKVFYDVIGGWLPEKLKKSSRLLNKLKEFDGLWVELPSMKTELEKMGMTNVSVVPNFKNLPQLEENELRFYVKEPYKLCTFSRVMKEKGIEDAINAVKAVNMKLNRVVFQLDIYGQITREYEEAFRQLRVSFPEYIRYKGVVAPNDSVAVLKNYFALLFPTYYVGEGLAGTLIDAMAAGIPTIASDWRYNREIIHDETGYLIAPKQVDQLTDRLIRIAQEPEMWQAKRKACLLESQKYRKDNVMKQIKELLDEQ